MELTLENTLDTGLTSGPETEQCATADADSACAKTQRLDNVGSTLDTSINPDFDLAQHLGAVLLDLEECVDCRRRCVGSSATVVGQDDGLDLRSILSRQVGIFVGLQTLEHDGQICVLGQPRQRRLPCQVGGGAKEELLADTSGTGLALAAGGTRLRVVKVGLLVKLTLSRDGGVQCQAHKLVVVTHGIDAPEHGLALVPLVLDVELPAKGLAGLGAFDDLLWCHGGVVGY